MFSHLKPKVSTSCVSGDIEGDWYEEDCTCDSEFMLENIKEIGGAIREKFHWVDITSPVYLVMDNAGGHGTNDAIASYMEILANHNIDIIWQIPQSLEINLIVLGIWMSIQSVLQ